MATERFKDEDRIESEIGDLIKKIYPYIPRPECPDEETMIGYYMEVLDKPELGKVEHHISECGFCAFEDSIAKQPRYELPHKLAKQKLPKEFYKDFSAKFMFDFPRKPDK